MQQRSLGSLRVSEVGLGCNNLGTRLDQEGATNVVNGALDAGVNFFDTADIYGATKSEGFLGTALGSRRADVVIATKFGMPIDDTHVGASTTQRCAEEALRLCRAVDVRGVEEVDARVERAVDDVGRVFLIESSTEVVAAKSYF